MSRILLKRYVLSTSPADQLVYAPIWNIPFITVELLLLLYYATTLLGLHTYMYKCINVYLSAESSLAVHKRYKLCGVQSTTRSKITIWPGWMVGWLGRSSETTANDNPIIAPHPLQHALHTIPYYYYMPSIPYHTINHTIPYHSPHMRSVTWKRI